MTQDYNALLYQKAQGELAAFIIGLQHMTGSEAITYAYEKVIKEDIVACLEECKLDNKEAKALYLKRYPLDFVYQEWLDNDYSHMEMLEDTLFSASKSAVKEMKINQRDSR